MSNNTNDQFKVVSNAELNSGINVQVSLRNRAMIAVMHIYGFSNLRNDKGLADQLEKANGTQNRKAVKAGRYLIDPEHKLYKAVQTARNTARTAFNEKTLPWEVDGARILSADAYFEFVTQMQGHRDNYNNAVNEFVSEWPNMIAQAKIDLGSLFNPQDYPSNIANTFGFELSFSPVSDASDFRVALPDAEVGRIQAEIVKRQAQLVQEAQGDLLKRMLEPLSRMVDKLSDRKGIFRDTLVENVQAVAKLARQYNFDNNPELDKLCDRMKEELNVNPRRLRESSYARKDTAAKARAIVNDLTAIMGGV